MRILVTGASGQLGSELSALPTSHHEITAVTHTQCDLRDAAAVDELLRSMKPDAVINCAAWTKVDLAESQPEEAFAMNRDGAANVARACAATQTLLCHMSTDYVFGDSAGQPLDEGAQPDPQNVYGASKLAGEDAVRSILPNRHLIVRTAWLYGRQGPNFVLTMLRLAQEQPTLRIVADQTGSPTWTGHLAPALLRLLEIDARGIFHLTSGESTTWHGFAEAILRDSGMGRVNVEAISSADYPVAARRPAYSVLDNRRWRELGEQPLRPWREGLRAYLARINAKAESAT